MQYLRKGTEYETAYLDTPDALRALAKAAHEATDPRPFLKAAVKLTDTNSIAFVGMRIHAGEGADGQPRFVRFDDAGVPQLYAA